MGVALVARTSGAGGATNAASSAAVSKGLPGDTPRGPTPPMPPTPLTPPKPLTSVKNTISCSFYLIDAYYSYLVTFII